MMKEINWKRKLTSRKLWTAVASFVSMMIVATGGAENTATQVTALIMAGASVVAYIIGEGLTDSALAQYIFASLLPAVFQPVFYGVGLVSGGIHVI